MLDDFFPNLVLLLVWLETFAIPEVDGKGEGWRAGVEAGKDIDIVLEDEETLVVVEEAIIVELGTQVESSLCLLLDSD